MEFDPISGQPAYELRLGNRTGKLAYEIGGLCEYDLWKDQPL